VHSIASATRSLKNGPEKKCGALGQNTYKRAQQAMCSLEHVTYTFTKRFPHSEHSTSSLQGCTRTFLAQKMNRRNYWTFSETKGRSTYEFHILASRVSAVLGYTSDLIEVWTLFCLKDVSIHHGAHTYAMELRVRTGTGVENVVYERIDGPSALSGDPWNMRDSEAPATIATTSKTVILKQCTKTCWSTQITLLAIRNVDDVSLAAESPLQHGR